MRAMWLIQRKWGEGGGEKVAIELSVAKEASQVRGRGDKCKSIWLCGLSLLLASCPADSTRNEMLHRGLFPWAARHACMRGLGPDNDQADGRIQ